MAVARREVTDPEELATLADLDQRIEALFKAGRADEAMPLVEQANSIRLQTLH